MDKAIKEKENLSQRLMKNIIWNFIGQIWLVILGFFATPFIVRALNVNFYGLYSLLGVIIGYFSFLQFGLGTAEVKFIAQYHANGESEKIRKVFWDCIIVYFIFGVMGTVLITFFSRFLAFKIFKIAPDLIDTAIFVFRIGSLGFLILMIMSVVVGVVQAIGEFGLLNRVGIIMGTLQISAVLLLLKLGFSLKEMIMSNLLVQVLGLYMLWGSVRKIMPYLSRPVWDKQYLVKLFKFGGFVSISSILSPVLLNIEKLFLTSLRPIASLTYYAIPFGLIDKLSLIRSSFSSVLFPAFSSLQGNEDNNLNRDLHARSALYIFFFYSFFLLFFLIFGREFLNAWIGGNFAFNSTRFLKILALAGLINSLAVPSLNALQGLNKPHIPALFHLVETVLYVPCAYFLIGRYGGSGAALAWFFRVLLDTLLLNWASCRLFGEKILSWYGRILFRGALPVLVSGLGLWGLKCLGLRFFSLANILGIFSLFLAYYAMVWQWGLDDFARMRIRQLVKEKIGG
ncbi:MAG: flippase [Candidatus Omnitrophota bacterium]